MELLELEAAMLRLHQARKPALPVSKLVVEDSEVVATSPEGTTARMSVEALLAKVALGQLNTGDLILPDVRGIERTIRLGLEEARVSAGEVDLVSAHATATKMGDVMEAQAMACLPSLNCFTWSSWHSVHATLPSARASGCQAGRLCSADRMWLQAVIRVAPRNSPPRNPAISSSVFFTVRCTSRYFLGL